MRGGGGDISADKIYSYIQGYFNGKVCQTEVHNGTNRARSICIGTVQADSDQVEI